MRRFDPLGCLFVFLLWTYFLAEYVYCLIGRTLHTLVDWLFNRDYCRDHFLPDAEAWDAISIPDSSLYPWSHEDEDNHNHPDLHPPRG